MLAFIKNWLNRRIINNSTMTQYDWDEAFSYLPLLKGLTKSEIQKLREKGGQVFHCAWNE